jgi:hypothetical protein
VAAPQTGQQKQAGFSFVCVFTQTTTDSEGRPVPDEEELAKTIANEGEYLERKRTADALSGFSRTRPVCWFCCH